MKRIRQISIIISDIEITRYNQDIANICFSILEILSSWMVIIWIDVNHKENWTIIEKGVTTNVFIVEDIFS